MRRYLATNLPIIWQDKTHPVSKLLYPLSLIYGLTMIVRRSLYKVGLIKSESVTVPVIVVGNITVGGTGKTPLVIWLSNYLQEKGFKVGIISRGYGGSSAEWPVDVSLIEKAEIVGDEAIMLKRKTDLPVVVSPIRADAAKMLIKAYAVDVIISDDGLQHLALNRDLEIIVIDSVQKFGNNRLLPSGPLRETPKSISTNAIKIYSGNQHLDQFKYWVKFYPIIFRNIKIPEQTLEIDEFRKTKVNAVAGIGRPEKFFNTLEALNIDVDKHHFPDHHVYQGNDFIFNNDWPIIMTEKDAVKCDELVNGNAWYLEITAIPNDHFINKLDYFIDSITAK